MSADTFPKSGITSFDWINTNPLFLAIGASITKEPPIGVIIDDNDIYDEIDTEMMKRGTLNHSTIRWEWVCDQCELLLKTEAKDFRLILFILQSLSSLKKCEDPTTLGAAIFSRFVNLWGDSAFPLAKKRLPVMRKIVDAIEQLYDFALRTGLNNDQILLIAQSLRSTSGYLKSLDNDLELKILSLANKIEALSIADDENGLPSLERMLKEPVKPKPIVEVKEKSPTNQPNIEIHPENLVLDGKNERALKQSLAIVADFLLNVDISNPLSYRLRRFATWYGINNPPELKRRDDVKTVIMPVSANAIDEYKIAIEREQIDHEIAQKLERSCHLQPFWIEGQLLAYRLASVCERKLAADAIYQETVQFVNTVPWLFKLQFTNGAPFISEDAKLWIEDFKTSRKSAGGNNNEMIGADLQTIIRAAREKANSGQVNEAIKILEDAEPAADTPRSHALWEMLMLECLSEWGMQKLVSSQANRLQNEISNLLVKDFEPDLITRITQLTKA
ncbi:type VI secretion system protein TssA [Bartonella sp. HY329]|uniref:type VI secretion system protein TssA n=1 Tax=unclassified Bartonella TaxID=2645622 RepID=UPI0021C5A89F|nr:MULTISPECIES: type VI secretion system protein TssA [unclassified Bartonella]UXM95226.1 type VI secretion system protein TssA [Bartonella sp. HY329]UXN09550.1 type VI secretion system protein TssA [Bartonella sp. HY328]